MIFKRRKQQSLLRRAIAFLWPEKGFARGWRYMRHRVERINDTPSNIALGFALGAFASFTPLFGLHFVIAALFAKVARVNIISALFGTAVGNPLTFPFIAAGSMSVGSLLLGRRSEVADGEGVVAAFVDMGSLLYDGARSAIGIAEPGTVSWSVAASRLGEFSSQFMAPYALGGLICGIPVAVASYYIVRPTIAAYQKRRAEKLARRRMERANEAKMPKAQADFP
jgi:uncharacterized protein (DUF2062 family)